MIRKVEPKSLKSSKSSKVTESELKVLKILWECGEATSAQIVEKLTETTDWKPKTIQTLITRLVSKGVLITDKTNKKSFTYYPGITEDEYLKYANRSFLQTVYDGSVQMMFTSFVKNQKLSKDDIAGLKKLLDEEES